MPVGASAIGGVRTGFSLHHNIPHHLTVLVFRYQPSLTILTLCSSIVGININIITIITCSTCVHCNTLTGYMNSPRLERNTQQLWANINSVYISSQPGQARGSHSHPVSSLSASEGQWGPVRANVIWYQMRPATSYLPATLCFWVGWGTWVGRGDIICLCGKKAN